ncbi:hypothetical protein JK386_07400 [Nocardioides sp. zg-536]|uniref:Uncharacterized protein n=1 Tax=Nocardioides faecalis TaxID=2803858 RepID=A0A938Y5Q3_9ACTN|nr:hypothetical protein [Nocardioides faecalis]MBM9459725.1 hypothetical protein [Nocardioides faecalis]MBS4753498.1 hypothetical protein [Nocardioides faecalis]QVI58244.1 hypothetical protein KG111_14695 [Nocardioides faecalis]
MQRSRRRWRFPSLLLGAFVLSVVVVVVACALATSPREAADQRRAPELPPPTATLRAGTGDPQQLLAPALALFLNEGQMTVQPAAGGPAVPVTAGPSADGWVPVSGEGLTEGLRVRLRSYDDRGAAW